MRSSEAKDPSLGSGLSYFIDSPLYLELIKKFVDQAEVRLYKTFEMVAFINTTFQISTCSGFAAMHLDNLKGIIGHRTSGVGGVCCARQDCWRANGLGDLQKGER
jgi:hypothetical protein